MVQGQYCQSCGQLAQSYHRPFWGLITEVLGDFLSVDGRVMRTMPSLIFSPGKITKAYLDGKRQRFVPPFRLYLLSSFIYFLLLFAFGDAHGWFNAHYATNGNFYTTLDAAALEQAAGENLTDEQITQILEAAEEGQAQLAESPDDAEPVVEGEGGESSNHVNAFRPDGRINREGLTRQINDGDSMDEASKAFFVGVMNRMADAYENQGMFFASIQSWAPRIALGLTPAMILLLAVVYPFSKRIYIYDHVIFTLHFQSWLYILLSVGLLFFWMNQMWFVWLLFLAPPIYIYRMLRTVYSSGRILSALRTLFILFILNLLLVLCFILLVIVGVAETSPVIGGVS